MKDVGDFMLLVTGVVLGLAIFFGLVRAIVLG